MFRVKWKLISLVLPVVAAIVILLASSSSGKIKVLSTAELASLNGGYILCCDGGMDSYCDCIPDIPCKHIQCSPCYDSETLELFYCEGVDTDTTEVELCFETISSGDSCSYGASGAEDTGCDVDSYTDDGCDTFDITTNLLSEECT